MAASKTNVIVLELAEDKIVSKRIYASSAKEIAWRLKCNGIENMSAEAHKYNINSINKAIDRGNIVYAVRLNNGFAYVSGSYDMTITALDIDNDNI